MHDKLKVTGQEIIGSMNVRWREKRSLREDIACISLSLSLSLSLYSDKGCSQIMSGRA